MHDFFRGRLFFFRQARLVAAMLLLLLMMPWTASHAAEDFLDPGQAFQLTARMIDPKTAEVAYAIADGYYMYREHFSFAADGAKLGAPVFPAGQVKFDETFQKNVETYRHSVRIRLPVEAQGPFVLKVTGQGCAEKGLCYPPMESSIKLDPAAAGMARDSARTAPPTSAGADTDSSGTGPFEAAIKGGNLLVIVPLFFLGGLALSLTPCVLPMVPILSSIIVGEGSAVTRRRGFVLSATYSLGMAMVYTGLGIAAGLIGEGLAAAFQIPWVLGAFGLLIAALALSMFDVYQLQMPAAIQSRLINASGNQAAGKLAGVFAMGALSGLVIGPCVAAPLLGVLVFISKTHNVMLGGCALFAIAVGMSMPLLLVGLSAGWLLPRAGSWMEAIKRFFGFLLLGVALWMVSPVIPASVQMLGWFVLFAGYGSYLLFNKYWGRASKVLGTLLVLAGLIQLVGVATGSRDALAPLTHLGAKPENSLEFIPVKSVTQLDSLLANTSGKPAMLDFYADWCVSCKEMEKLTFTDAHVKQKLAGMVLLQADVTANNADDKALLKRFNLYGPPGIIFFDRSGHAIKDGRVVGFQNADKFLSSLIRIDHTL